MTTLSQYLAEFYGQVNEMFLRSVDGISKGSSGNIDAGYSIFYSNPRSTLCDGPLYYLGLNPGGDAAEQGWKRETLKDWDEKAMSYSAYLPECDKWKDGDDPAPLQERTRKLLECLQDHFGSRRDITTVFSTNAFFFRTRDTHTLSRFGIRVCDHREPDKLCLCCGFWSFHKEWLKIVRPKVVVCNGNAEGLSAYAFIRSRFPGSVEEAKPRRIYGRFYFKSFRIIRPFWNEDEPVVVLGVPHMSRFAPGQPFMDAISSALQMRK